MATFEEMEPAPVDRAVRSGFAFEFQSEDLNGVEVSPWIIVPAGVTNLSYFLEILTAGVAFVEITFSKIVTIKTGTPVGVKWDPGDVSANTTTSSSRINAFRLVMLSDDARLFVNAS